MKTNTDWLEVEDALFSSAQIVSAPGQHKPRPYKCTFPNCGRATTLKNDILHHIHSIHFKVPGKEHKNISKEAKQAALQYLEVDQSLLGFKNKRIELPRRKKGSTLNFHSTEHNVFGYESLDVTESRCFENATTDGVGEEEDEDDKDELLNLLATVRSSTFN